MLFEINDELEKVKTHYMMLRDLMVALAGEKKEADK